MLQRLAAETEGLWLGTNLMLLPLHNPVEMAEVGAFLDVMTGGRFLLGVGPGYRTEEFALFKVPMAERVSRLTEGRDATGDSPTSPSAPGRCRRPDHPSWWARR